MGTNSRIWLNRASIPAFPGATRVDQFSFVRAVEYFERLVTTSFAIVLLDVHV